MHFGPLEVGLIALVILLLFGARRLPDLARSIGQSIKEFRKGVKHDDTGKKRSQRIDRR